MFVLTCFYSEEKENKNERIHFQMEKENISSLPLSLLTAVLQTVRRKESILNVLLARWAS